MLTIERSVLVEFAADAMLGLVNDVGAYPQFLPWCSAASSREMADGSVEATIEIRYKGLHQAFTTRNIISSRDGLTRLEMSLISGPFKSLQGEWRFHALEEAACKVTLDLQYDFSSKLLEKAVGPVFRLITETLVEAFVHRAESTLGREGQNASR